MLIVGTLSSGSGCIKVGKTTLGFLAASAASRRLCDDDDPTAEVFWEGTVAMVICSWFCPVDCSLALYAVCQVYVSLPLPDYC